MAAKDDLGRAGEERAAAYLHSRGFTIVDRNWRCPDGEIDIVATTGDQLVIVEVKTRRSDRFGHPFEAIDERKRRRLWRLGVAWIVTHRDRARGRRLRIDAIAICGRDVESAAIEHLEDIA